MTFWITFWAALLILALIGFAGLAVVVSLGAFKDVLALFQSIDKQHEETERTAGSDASKPS